jgi:P27 family predicted phage terminase small subunit
MKNSVSTSPGRAPSRLSTEARALWRSIVEQYNLDDPAGLAILATTCEALDRMREAQRTIKRDGATVLDRFKQPKIHPATLLERDSRAAVLAGLKALNLDLEPLRDRIGRPAGS